MADQEILPIVLCGDFVLRRPAGQVEQVPAPALPTLTPVEEDGYATFYEGCLGVPGLTAVVRRYRSVRVDAWDEQGRPFSKVYTGWPARIAQHEVDHLGGVLYLDRAETRSLSTVENYARHWSGADLAVASEALAFTV